MSDDDPMHPTIHDEYLVSLLDGKHYKVLTHHLTRLGYTAASYREKFGPLPITRWSLLQPPVGVPPSRIRRTSASDGTITRTSNSRNCWLLNGAGRAPNGSGARPHRVERFE